MSNDTITEPIYRVTKIITDGKSVYSESRKVSLLTLNTTYPLIAQPDGLQSRPMADGFTISYLIEEQVGPDEWREVDDPRTYEFSWAPEQEGLGALLVTDIELMLRPAQPGQWHKQCPFNTGRVWDIMSLGTHPVDGPLAWHINAPGMTADQAATKLDPIWHAYFDSFSLSNWHINGKVVYIGALYKTLEERHYGMSDAYFQGTVYVFTREFNDWAMAHSASLSDEPNRPNWNFLLDWQIRPGQVGDIPFDELEARLAAGLPSQTTTRLLVVRPADNDAGYATRGFWLKFEG